MQQLLLRQKIQHDPILYVLHAGCNAKCNLSNLIGTGSEQIIIGSSYLANYQFKCCLAWKTIVGELSNIKCNRATIN